MLKNLIYAILLGVGMAACLADQDSDTEETVTGGPVIGLTEEDAPADDPADHLLAKGRAGKIRIGMSIEEMRQHVPEGHQLRDTTLHLEGQQYTAYILTNADSPMGLLIEQQCEPDCQVWRIRVRDDDYKTAQGISIGSKYGEVQQYYPIAYTSLGEAGFVAVSESAGMSFILDTRQLNTSRLHQLKPEEIPANTIVTEILIY